MGRKGIQTKALIKSKAYQLFADRGFSKIIMKDICEACNLSRGGLYRHYGSTQAIFEEILDGVAAETNAVVQDGIQGGVSAVELLDNLLERLRREMLDKTRSLSYAVYEYSCTCKSDFMLRMNYEAEQKWQSLIVYGIRRGEFLAVDAKTMADMILYVYQGIRMWSRVIPMDEETVGNIIKKIRKDLVMEDETI